MSGDVGQSAEKDAVRYDLDTLADWLGALPESSNVFDITDEATTVITIDVETLARCLIEAEIVRDGSAAAIAAAAWDEGRKFGQTHWASNYWPEVPHRPDVNPYRSNPSGQRAGS